jgi:hypothetical protein
MNRPGVATVFVNQSIKEKEEEVANIDNDLNLPMI